MLHKNVKLQKTLNSNDMGPKSTSNENLDMVSKITDQNIKNVYTQLEKHKVLLEDRFNRMEI